MLPGGPEKDEGQNGTSEPHFVKSLITNTSSLIKVTLLGNQTVPALKRLIQSNPAGGDPPISQTQGLRLATVNERAAVGVLQAACGFGTWAVGIPAVAREGRTAVSKWQSQDTNQEAWFQPVAPSTHHVGTSGGN